VQELRREVDIDAPPERVWAVLTDFRSGSSRSTANGVAGFDQMNAALKARVEQAS
jgi:carbon monoxide dehydrogenase subunit G